MLTKEWTFIKIRAAEFEPHKLCATSSIECPTEGPFDRMTKELSYTKSFNATDLHFAVVLLFEWTFGHTKTYWPDPGGLRAGVYLGPIFL
jgi:hypothetical protein